MLKASIGFVLANPPLFGFYCLEGGAHFLSGAGRSAEVQCSFIDCRQYIGSVPSVKEKKILRLIPEHGEFRQFHVRKIQAWEYKMPHLAATSAGKGSGR